MGFLPGGGAAAPTTALDDGPKLPKFTRKDSPVNGTSAPVFRLMSDS
jgi:hypothetical protein